MYVLDYEINQISSLFQEAKQDRIDSLFLQGVYNPYIRRYPFPPLHVNLNYLVDPRSIAFGLDYNHLYDAHYDGPAERRADPLLIPGNFKTFMQCIHSFFPIKFGYLTH